MLLLGSETSQVASALDVPERTVRDWAKRLGGIDALRQGRLDDLLYTYLSEALQTLAAQSIVFRDPEYLKGQDANSAAILHGVLADKAVRILAAREVARPAEEIRERQEA